MMQATHSTSSTTQLPQLPAALAAHILQFVPQRQRLSCCALVCSTWREAAAQVTVHIDCTKRSSAAAEALEAWLEQHGEQVQSLELRFDEGYEDFHLQLQLPWAQLSQLQSLSLAWIRLPAISSGNSSAAAAAAGSGNSSSGGQTSNTPLLPKLTQLHLEECHMHSLDCLLQLASHTGLTSLIAESCCFRVRTADEEALTTALLQQLPQLVVLRLPRAIMLSTAAIKHVAAMRSLQHLQLVIYEGSTFGDCFADLPSSLTRLQLKDMRRGLILRVRRLSLPLQLQRLTSLQQLQLERCSLLPAVLASIPQLQHLELQGCLVLAVEATGSRGRNPAATAALLGALQQLTRLQHLEIQYSELDTAGPPPQQWAALTASTQLSHLCLIQHSQPLPQGAAQHMFPAGRQLPRLQKLVVQSSVQLLHDWCLDGPDLGSIISCCPQLLELCVDRTVCAGADMSALLQLPSSCSSLAVGGDGFADAAASVVAQLTALRELRWEWSPELTEGGLLQLTALQGLSQLRVRDFARISSSMCEAAGAPGCLLIFESTDTKGPVWQQLQAAVAAAASQGVLL